MSDLLVWYDGACPLCRREIALMRRLDRGGAIDFVDVSGADGPGGAEFGRSRGGDGACPPDRAALLARFHAREDGRVVSGAAAFAAMWRAVPALRPLGLAARNPAVLALLERLYRVFLRVRPRLQRLARWLDNRRSAR